MVPVHLIIISHFVFLSLSLYYLIAKDTFTISIFDFLKYTPLKGVWEIFHNLNIAIVVIPMTIVIMSLSGVKSKFIIITAKFFSIGGMILSLINITKFLNIAESFRLGLITVTNESSLVQKEIIFKEQLHEKLKEYAISVKNPRDFLQFIDKEISQNWETYTEIIKTKKSQEVGIVAEKISQKLHIKYLESLEFLEKINNPIVNSTNSSNYDSYFWFKLVIGTAVVGGACYGIHWIYKKFMIDNSLGDNVINMSKIQNDESTIKIQTKQEIQYVNGQAEKIHRVLENNENNIKGLSECIKLMDNKMVSLDANIKILESLSNSNVKSQDELKIVVDNMRGQIGEMAQITSEFSFQVEKDLNEEKSKLQELGEKCQSLETKLNSISDKIGSFSIKTSENITQSELAAQAAEKRLIEAAQSLQQEFALLKNSTEDSVREMKKLKKDIDDRLVGSTKLQEEIRKTLNGLKKKGEEFDKYEKRVSTGENLFGKVEGQLEGKAS